MKRRPRTRHGDAEAAHEGDGGLGTKGFDEELGHAHHEPDEDPHDAADVGQRKDDGVAILVREREPGHGGAPGRDQGRVAVLDPLGRSGGARRVEDPSRPSEPSERRVGTARGCRQSAGEAVGQVVTEEVVGMHHPESWAPIRQAGGQLPVVDAAPDRGHEQQGHPDLVDDEGQLALPVAREQGDLDRAPMSQRRCQHAG